MDIVERLREGKSAGGYWREKEAADEIERLRLREETLSGIIDGMTARFIEAQGAVEEIERLREALTWIERHPVEESKQWEVAVKEMKRLARSALQQKESK